MENLYMEKTNQIMHVNSVQILQTMNIILKDMKKGRMEIIHQRMHVNSVHKLQTMNTMIKCMKIKDGINSPKYACAFCSQTANREYNLKRHIMPYVHIHQNGRK